jgi:hypothetical protein
VLQLWIGWVGEAGQGTGYVSFRRLNRINLFRSCGGISFISADFKFALGYQLGDHGAAPVEVAGCIRQRSDAMIFRILIWPALNPGFLCRFNRFQPHFN